VVDFEKGCSAHNHNYHKTTIPVNKKNECYFNASERQNNHNGS